MAFSLDNVKRNKVTTDLTSYPVVFMGKTGVGKTYSMLEYLEEISPEGKFPLFLMFEDRGLHIKGLSMERITSYKGFTDVYNELKTNPEAKNKVSCVVIDTANAMETLITSYITDSKGKEILGDLQMGQGNQLLKAKEGIINKIRELGFPVFFTYQVKDEWVNFLKQSDGRIYKDTLNKKTKEQVLENASMVGFIDLDHSSPDPQNSDRIVTFVPTSELPDLKSSFPLPARMKVSELATELKKVIMQNDAEDLTDENKTTVYAKEVPFATLKQECTDMCKRLYDAGYSEEVANVIKTQLGYSDEKNKVLCKISDLVEPQYDLLDVIHGELKQWCDSYKV